MVVQCNTTTLSLGTRIIEGFARALELPLLVRSAGFFHPSVSPQSKEGNSGRPSVVLSNLVLIPELISFFSLWAGY